MAFGQSVPFAVPVAAVSGFLGGELCGVIAETVGLSEFWQRLATIVGHAVVGASAGYTVNLMFGADCTGAAVTTVQSLGTAVIHDSLRHTNTVLHATR